MSSTVWSIVVWYLLPPPLILTILLLVPVPSIVKRGLLGFTRNVLYLNMECVWMQNAAASVLLFRCHQKHFYHCRYCGYTIPAVGNAKLVHVILLTCGLSLIGSGQHTYRLNMEAHSEGASDLTPNQRINILARKWREERNFWIAALTFLLWAMLYRFYNLLMDHMRLQDRVKELEAGGAPPPPPGEAPAKVKAEPSAPPMPAAAGGKSTAAKAGSKETKKAA